MSLEIRREHQADIAAIRQVTGLAFGGQVEVRIIDGLRADNSVSLSLVALEGRELVGHVLFSPVKIQAQQGAAQAVALGPLSVLPGMQRRGIGTRLIWVGLERLRQVGHRVVIVLGHASYYPRFGFAPGAQFGLLSQWQVPADVFMALELQPGALQGVNGLVYYHPVFTQA